MRRNISLENKLHGFIKDNNLPNISDILLTFATHKEQMVLLSLGHLMIDKKVNRIRVHGLMPDYKFVTNK